MSTWVLAALGCVLTGSAATAQGTSSSGLASSLLSLSRSNLVTAQDPSTQTVDTIPELTLRLSPSTLDFASVETSLSAVQSVQVTNVSASSLTVEGLNLIGLGAADYSVSVVSGATLPFAIAPGITETIDVTFLPTATGSRRAALWIDTDVAGATPDVVRLLGAGRGPLGAEYFVDTGWQGFVDSQGRTWTADFAFNGGSFFQTLDAIAGTNDAPLFRTQRHGLQLDYHLDLPTAGTYEVTFYFAESEHQAAGLRLMDVLAEGILLADDLDLYVAAGHDTAYTEMHTVDVLDGTLDLSLQASVGKAAVSAISVKAVPLLSASPDRVDFGAVASGDTAQNVVTLTNDGLSALTIDTLSILLDGAGTGESYTIDIGGSLYPGSASDVSYSISEAIGVGGSLPVTITFAPTTSQYDAALVRFEGDFDLVDVPLTGLGGHEGDPYLHVVIVASDFVVDYEQNGSEPVTLDGSLSHTHEPGRAIIDFDWTEGQTSLSNTPVTTQTLGLGAHDITLTIEDDNVPPRQLADTHTVDVRAPDDIPGVLVRYYDAAAAGTTATALLDAVPTNADYGEVTDGFFVTGTTTVGGSPFATDTMVQMTGDVDIQVADNYSFTAMGGVARRIEVDGMPAGGSFFLNPGKHSIHARFAVDALIDQPVEVKFTQGAGSRQSIDESLLTHDETMLLPVINSMPTTGVDTGGNLIVIDGVGYFPDSSVVVHWGATDLDATDFTVLGPTQIQFLSPPGTGTIQVTVETTQGVSNARDFVYDSNGPVPVNFATLMTLSVPQATTGAWGPDGNFYVTSLDGRLSVVDFSDDYQSSSVDTYTGVSLLSNPDTLGIAFNPYDSDSPITLYVAHAKHFVNGGGPFAGPSPYTGQVSMLQGPNFDNPVPIITGLPSSNHDHAINGMEFDNNGDLLICVGSATNAGVKHPNSGDLPESPLSATILRAFTSDPNFDGAITYVDSISGIPNDDQVFGEEVDVASGDVEVYAHGVRNAYDLVLTVSGLVFATDNGPNNGFGAASTSATTEVSDPFDVDELLRIKYGNYYGSPNRSRGRYDDRQNVYYGTSAPSTPEFTQAIATVQPSSNGMDEYRADTFQGQLRGDIVVQKWLGDVRRFVLSSDGQDSAAPVSLGPSTTALGLEAGPGGAILTMDHLSGRLHVLGPVDPSAVGLVVQDIFPWRAPATGGTQFVIGGVGFGNLGDTSVTIGGKAATLISVSSTRIVGTIPAETSPTTDLLDVAVTVGATTDVHVGAFRYLLGVGQEIGRWEDLGTAPQQLGEVSAAIVDDRLYAMGEGSSQTLTYDLITRLWRSSVAARLFQGHHMSTEVIDGKVYLIGGLAGGSEGKVQIYDPVSDTWSQGTDMPWAGGSVNTCAIGDLIYTAGGIVGSTTVNNCAVYDTVLDSWTTLAPMPQGRNHAAAGTDGTKFYVFGGRDGGNVVANGFDDTQIYDPATDTWDSSSNGGSTLAPLPIGRGGTGKAIFYQNEFYVFGGETLNGPGAVAGNVYDRVDVYDPVTNTWRLDNKMPIPRHGIFPVEFQNEIYFVGGGTVAGFSQSSSFDRFTR